MGFSFAKVFQGSEDDLDGGAGLRSAGLVHQGANLESSHEGEVQLIKSKLHLGTGIDLEIQHRQIQETTKGGDNLADSDGGGTAGRF